LKKQELNSMANTDTLDLIYDNMFRKTGNLTQKQEEQLRRYEAAFTIWQDKPYMPDKEIRNFLMKSYGISQSQAYSDIKNLQLLFGKIKNSSKEWYRFMANELVKDAIIGLDEAENKIGIMRAVGKIKAAEAFMKINRLNNIDADPYDYSQIVPQNFEPTNDPAVAGLKGVTREELQSRIKKLKKQYSEEIEIQDVTYEEMPRPAAQ
jgi:hypothetical protein